MRCFLTPIILSLTVKKNNRLEKDMMPNYVFGRIGVVKPWITYFCIAHLLYPNSIYFLLFDWVACAPMEFLVIGGFFFPGDSKCVVLLPCTCCSLICSI